MILNNGRKFLRQIPDEQYLQLTLLIWANTVETSPKSEFSEGQFIIDELNAHLKNFTNGYIMIPRLLSKSNKHLKL